MAIVSKTKIDKPIILTSYGESLSGYTADEFFEEHSINILAGVHEVCRGFVDTRVVSSSHSVLRCRQCHLRVYIPNEVKTLGDLRNHFSRFNPK